MNEQDKEIDKEYLWTRIYKDQAELYIRPGAIIKRLIRRNHFCEHKEITSEIYPYDTSSSQRGLPVYNYRYLRKDLIKYSQQMGFISDLFNGEVYVGYKTGDSLPKELFEI